MYLCHRDVTKFGDGCLQPKATSSMFGSDSESIQQAQAHVKINGWN